MILVLTTSASDYSHLKFIDWLEYYKADYEILSGEEIYFNRKSVLVDEEGDLIVNGRNFSKDVSVVLNRRWVTSSNLLEGSDFLQKNINSIIIDELYELKNYFDYTFKNALWFPNIQGEKVNKLEMLRLAKEIGLAIPDFILTNNKNELLNFKRKHDRIVTKAIGNFQHIEVESFGVNPIYTKVVEEDLIEKLNSHFTVSLFQRYIDKLTEYRILYFNGAFYSVELLSQEQTDSLIDSRCSNADNEVRIIRSELSLKIQTLLHKLMKRIDLNIGCIDLIKGLDGVYYFLEVNPVGQISGYSSRGNLYFEKEVVEKLILLDERRKGCA